MKILVYFLCKNYKPHSPSLQKSPPLSQNRPSKNWCPVKSPPPFFKNLVRGSPDLAESGMEVHTTSMRDKPGWLSLFWQFLCKGLSPFNLKGYYYKYAWSCILCEGGTSFCTRKHFRFLFMFSIGLPLFIALLLFPQLVTFFVLVYSF